MVGSELDAGDDVIDPSQTQHDEDDEWPDPGSGLLILPEVGANLGRFHLLEKIGRGRASTVFAAYDRDLDRKVALKLIRPELNYDTKTRDRLLRAATDLARLHHPNVVDVFDAGVEHGVVYLSMELVEGTLQDWMEAGPHLWEEAVELFIGVGRALVAAHRMGVVHANLQPRNVLIRSREGRLRACVADFGLGGAADFDTRDDEEPLSRDEATLSDLNADVLLAGTPAYLPPEHFRGERTGTRSDQYSFCVLLYEALYGRRPFGGETLPALAAAVLSGDRGAPPAEIEVPRWLRQVLDRGLSRDPALRFASMEELLRELEQGRRAPRLPGRAWWAVAGTLLAGAAGVGWTLAENADCDAAGDSVAQVWSASNHAAVREAVLSSSTPYAESTWRRARADLDSYASRWGAAARAACRADTDPKALSPRQICLERGRQLLVATVDELQHAEPSSIEWVIGTVASLPRPEACATVDGARVSLRRPEEAARAAAVEDARARLARVEVLRRLGRLESARVEAQALEAEAEDLAYDPFIAEVDLGVARTLGDAGDSEGAIQRLEHAVWIGTALGYRDVVLAASIDLVRATATRPAGASDALAWARRAGALIESSGEDDPSVQIALLRAEAEVRREAGDFDSAEALLSEALSVGSRDPGEAALQEATLRRERAAVLTERADLDAAASDLRQSTRALEQYLGPHHPHHGEAVVELAGVLAESFEQREAMQLYRRALQIFEADLASGSAGAVERLAKTHAKLANSLTLTGEDEDAIAAARRSVELIEQHHGPAHPALALPLVMEAQALVGAGRYAESLGRLERARPLLGSEPRGRAQRKLLAQADMVLSRAAVAQGRIDDAAEAARRNVALMDELTGSDSRETARARLNLGTIYGMSGEHERCILQLEKALPVLEQNFGRLHPYVLLTLNNLSAANRLAGDPDRAVELARQTLELAGDVPDSPIASKGRAHFNLGAAYFDSGQNEEAIAELETALQLYSSGSASGPGELADVQATLGLALWSTDRVRARVLLQHARSGYEAIDTPQSLAAARDLERRLR